MMISQTDRDRELYESRLKMRRDISAALAEARQAGEAEGLQKGIEKGIEKGMEKGMDKGRIEVHVQRIRYLQRRLRREASPLEDLQARSCEDLADFAAQLEGELDAKLGDGE